jgi:pyridoxine 5-phosphate synthase
MTRLSVNVNKIATLRNARGGNDPNVIEAALNIQSFGAQGITVHPRPDGRHITFEDVKGLRPVVSTEFNIEGYPSKSFEQLVCAVRPEQVTLVPDPPEALTSNAGWDVMRHRERLKEVLAIFREHNIRTSLFTSTDFRHIESAAEVGADRIELYTEPYAIDFHRGDPNAAKPFSRAATFAHEHGLGVNAGHDLNLQNLRHFAEKVPFLAEVSIGHALISQALYLGLEQTIAAYLNCLSLDPKLSK